MTLSFALSALGFSSSSAADAVMGLLLTSSTSFTFPHTHTGKSGGQVQERVSCLKAFLTILSSNEWKVITAILPSGASLKASSVTASARPLSSPFTSMRTA